MCSLLHYTQVQLSKHQSYNGLYFSSRSRYVQPQDFNIKKIIETFDPNLSITSLQTAALWNKTCKSQKEYNWSKTKNWIGKNGNSYLESKSKSENIKNIFAVGV